MRVPRLASFRTRLLLVVLAVAVLPIVLVGGWLTRRVARSGEQLLRHRLEVTVNDAGDRIGQRFLAEQSALLDLADSPAMREAVSDSGVPRGLEGLAAPGAAQLVALRDNSERTVLRFPSGANTDGGAAGAAVPMAVPVHAAPLEPRIGTLEARVPLGALVSSASPSLGAVGSVLGVYETDGVPLLPLPFELPSPLTATAEWGGDSWLLATRELKAPRLLVIAAAPISPFAQPFRAAAREGVALLALTGVLGFLIAAVQTTRMTRSLQGLATAADQVGAGALEMKLEDRGQDEVSRVARAFNNMTANLTRTLQDLADHKALAATGEFAASLAHEIRNPLSAVRLDLQVVEEQLPEDSEVRRVQQRALAEIRRLDATLSSALQSARGGRQARATVTLSEPLEAAIATAQSGLGPHIMLQVVSDPSSLSVIGDAPALQQLFLNLLLNATQAARSSVRVRAERVMDEVLITITDDGPGIPGEQRERVFDPLFTTRTSGTGLGLTIAQRIARAHGGEIVLSAVAPTGTAAQVHLPAPPAL